MLFSKQVLTPLVILAVVSVIGAFIADDSIRKSYGARDLQPIIQEALQGFDSNPKLDFTPVDPLIMGAPDNKANMIITEFADFRCPHCRHAAPVFKAFVEGHPDVQLRFEAWPLDGECNTSIPSSNGASCLLARAVNCVQKVSGHGWAAHEYVYENQEKYVDRDAARGALADIAKATGANEQQLKTCVDSPEAIEQIQKQAAVGTALNLNGTPTVFVNGRKLPYGQMLQILTEVYQRLGASSH